MNRGGARFRAVSRQPLVDRVIQQLQEQISLGRLAPGTRLPPEPELMAQLQVGRSTLREAVRVLVHAGLLEVRQGDGTYVRSPTGGEPLEQRLRRAAVLEVYEVRHLLELEMAELAALRRDDADLRRMRACLQRREAARVAGDDRALLEADIEFHMAVAAATKNAVLTDLYRGFSAALRTALAELIADRARLSDQARLHEDLLRAITAQDSRAARHATSAYLGNMRERMQELAGL